MHHRHLTTSRRPSFFPGAQPTPCCLRLLLASAPTAHVLAPDPTRDCRGLCFFCVVRINESVMDGLNSSRRAESQSGEGGSETNYRPPLTCQVPQNNTANDTANTTSDIFRVQPSQH